MPTCTTRSVAPRRLDHLASFEHGQRRPVSRRRRPCRPRRHRSSGWRASDRAWQSRPRQCLCVRGSCENRRTCPVSRRVAAGPWRVSMRPRRTERRSRHLAEAGSAEISWPPRLATPIIPRRIRSFAPDTRRLAVPSDWPPWRPSCGERHVDSSGSRTWVGSFGRRITSQDPITSEGSNNVGRDPITSQGSDNVAVQ